MTLSNLVLIGLLVVGCSAPSGNREVASNGAIGASGTTDTTPPDVEADSGSNIPTNTQPTEITKANLSGRWEGTYSYFDGSKYVNCEWGALEFKQTAALFEVLKSYMKCGNTVATQDIDDYVLQANQILKNGQVVGSFSDKTFQIQFAPVANQTYTLDISIGNGVLTYKEKTTSFGYQFQGKTFTVQYVGPVTGQLPGGLGPAF